MLDIFILCTTLLSNLQLISRIPVILKNAFTSQVENSAADPDLDLHLFQKQHIQ